MYTQKYPINTKPETIDICKSVRLKNKEKKRKNKSRITEIFHNALWVKKPPKILLCWFCVDHLLLGMGLGLNIGLDTEWDYIGEN